MFKRILVATDASEYSIRALSTAVELAKQFHSEIELLYVFTLPMTYLGDYTGSYYLTFTEEQIIEIGKEVMDTTLKGIDVSQVTINKRILTGHPATVILDEIKRDIDLVVMGTHGHGAIAGAIIGSVTQHVLANAPCPVLVVK